jgi:hypothetical protein
MKNFTIFFYTGISLILFSCKKPDTISPFILINEDTVIHYFGETYTDAGAEVIDDKDCNAGPAEIILNEVDIYHYGTYSVKYYASDEAGNSSRATRLVDVILKPENYYALVYTASDTCTSGNYYYEGLIQDCDCGDNAVTVSNISNFGPSATFTLPIEGTYNELINLDTSLFAITFLGSGEISSGTDTIRWSYSISDSVTMDVCTSTWLKN